MKTFVQSGPQILAIEHLNPLISGLSLVLKGAIHILNNNTTLESLSNIFPSLKPHSCLDSV